MNKADKAHQILVEGRLTVDRVGDDSGLIVATCRGDSAEYRLGYDPGPKQWRCTCAASAEFHRTCSHLLSLMLVTVKQPGPRPGEGEST